MSVDEYLCFAVSTCERQLDCKDEEDAEEYVWKRLAQPHYLLLG